MNELIEGVYIYKEEPPYKYECNTCGKKYNNECFFNCSFPHPTGIMIKKYLYFCSPECLRNYIIDKENECYKVNNKEIK
jgi:hypothetical protein